MRKAHEDLDAGEFAALKAEAVEGLDAGRKLVAITPKLTPSLSANMSRRGLGLDQRAIITAQHLPRADRGRPKNMHAVHVSPTGQRSYSDAERAALAGVSCHTQAEIAEAVNLPQQTISRLLGDFTQIGKVSEMGKTAATFGDFKAPLERR